MQHSVGDRLPDVVLHPSATQLFRFSAVTWNTHRIHYDVEWARHEGHKGVLVHSHLHAANALRPLTDGLGPEWAVTKAAYRVVRPAAAGETLTATAQVTAASEDGNMLEFTIRELNEAGEPCCEGTAVAVRRS
jgi:3-methylfumaryl-CoA hydratase